MARGKSHVYALLCWFQRGFKKCQGGIKLSKPLKLEEFPSLIKIPSFWNNPIEALWSEMVIISSKSWAKIPTTSKSHLAEDINGPFPLFSAQGGNPPDPGSRQALPFLYSPPPFTPASGPHFDGSYDTLIHAWDNERSPFAELLICQELLKASWGKWVFAAWRETHSYNWFKLRLHSCGLTICGFHWAVGLRKRNVFLLLLSEKCLFTFCSYLGMV